MYAIPAVPEREPKVYLYSHGYDYDSDTVYPDVREFESVEALCQELSLDFIEKNVGRQYEEPIKIVTRRASGFSFAKVGGSHYTQPEEYYFSPAFYIIRTDEGEKLTAEELRPVYWEIRRRKLKKRYGRERWGRKADHCYGSWRSPKTNNELRQAYAEKDEGEPPIRAKRNRKHLPTLWCDRYAHCDANWKTQSKRKRQYRPV